MPDMRDDQLALSAEAENERCKRAVRVGYPGGFTPKHVTAHRRCDTPYTTYA